MRKKPRSRRRVAQARIRSLVGPPSWRLSQSAQSARKSGSASANSSMWSNFSRSRWSRQTSWYRYWRRRRAPAPLRQPGPRHYAFWDLLGRLGRFLLHLCGLGLCLVHLRLRPGLGCVALGLALLLLGLALAPEVRVVRQVADGFLDLAL